MKLLSIICFTLFITLVTQAQTKRALIVAISNYGGETGKGWRTISSVNDTTFLLPALQKQGFDNKNISLVINEKATIDGLKAAFEELAKSTKTNDIVVIHISAHGEQIEDDANKDELDGLDESIVTYGAISPFHSKDYEKDVLNYLRDDQLEKYINAVRKAAGPKGDVLVFMDNCHSGSGTRNAQTSEIVRGGQNPFVSKNYKPGSAASDLTVSRESPKEDPSFAPYIVISASRAEELNSEIKIDGKGYGSLSYAVSKAFENMQSTSTYQGFFSYVQTQMGELAPKQHPVLEGNGTQRTFWGGKFVTAPTHFMAVPEDETFVSLNGGIISGISEGSIIHLYPIDTYDTTKAKLVSKGIISSSSNYSAKADLSIPLTIAKTPYWAFVKSVKFPVPAIGVSFAPLDGETSLKTGQQKLIGASLEKNELVDLQAQPSLRLISKNDKDLLINVKTDYAIDTFASNTVYTDELKKAIERFVQYSFIKSYVIQDSTYRVAVRLLPTTNDRVDTTKMNQKFVNGNYTFAVGEKLKIEVTNNSSFRIYVNVLDLEPTGAINAILPKKSKKVYPNELFVEPGETKVFPNLINLRPPIGEEVFKVFVSKKEMDLEQIATTKGDKTRDVLTELEQIVRNSYKPSTRSGMSSKEGAVFNVPFTISEK